VQQRFCRQNLGQQPPVTAQPLSNQALTKQREHGASSQAGVDAVYGAKYVFFAPAITGHVDSFSLVKRV
jgi:hypothetical protein